MENLRIGIVGNIGVGKSTLVEAASSPPLDRILLSLLPEEKHQKIHAFPEEFNPEVLAEFYKDPVKHAFMAQLEFLNGRLRREENIDNCSGIILEDRTLAEDYHIFGQAQRVLNNMTLPQFLAYQGTYGLMTAKVKEPDLVVYLRASVPALLQRIAQRGRESEKSIPPEYLETLNGLYEEFVFTHLRCPALIIDANEDRPLEEYLRDTLHKVAEKIRSLDLRITTPGLSDWVRLPETRAALKAVEAEKKLEDYLSRHQKLIAIAGNVGLGKSTLAAMMEHSLRLGASYENPEENLLLEKFLSDKPKYCYDLQKHFLQIRAGQQKKGRKSGRSHVLDRSLPEDLLIFCRQFLLDGHLTKSQYDLLDIEFRRANRELPQADLIVLLQGTPELAWQRIQQRGREMEIQGGWKKSEIEQLGHLYRTYSRDVRDFGFHCGPVLEINVNKLDLTNRIHGGYIFEQIYQALQ